MPGEAKEPGPVSAIKTERGLTEAQQLTLDAVRDYIEKHGIPPSFRDVMRARKLVSTSAVQEAFRRLQAVGAITVREGVPRSVRVLWSKPKSRHR